MRNNKCHEFLQSLSMSKAKTAVINYCAVYEWILITFLIKDYVVTPIKVKAGTLCIIPLINTTRNKKLVVSFSRIYITSSPLIKRYILSNVFTLVSNHLRIFLHQRHLGFLSVYSYQSKDIFSIYATTAFATASAILQGTALPICVYTTPLFPQNT